MKRFATLLTLLAGAVPVMSGCGAEEVAGVDVAQAAQATSAKGTARMTMSFRMTGMGLPQAVSFEAEGVAALAEPKMSLRMNLSELISLAGVGGAGDLEIRLDGGDLYVKPPQIEGLDLPRGWIAVDLRPVARAMGIDPEIAGLIFNMDPAAQLRAMGSAGLDEVGTEEIDGVETTRLKGTSSVRDLLAGLPEAKRAAAERLLKQLEALADDPGVIDRESPIELWVDGNSIIRRMKTTTEMPTQGASPGGTLQMSYDLSDFGAELDVSKPDDVTDFTDRLVDALSAAGLKAGGGTSAG